MKKYIDNIKEKYSSSNKTIKIFKAEPNIEFKIEELNISDLTANDIYNCWEIMLMPDGKIRISKEIYDRIIKINDGLYICKNDNGEKLIYENYRNKYITDLSNHNYNIMYGLKIYFKNMNYINFNYKYL